MAGTVVLVESSRQAELALSLLPKPTSFVALSPSAAYRLENAGIAYLKPEDVYDDAALCNRRDAILDSQTRWADWIDSWLGSRIPAFAEAGFNPARIHFPYLKILFDALRFRASFLEGLYAKLAPEKVVYFDSPTKPATWELFFKDSLTARCLPDWSKARGVALEALPPAGDERFYEPARKRSLSSGVLARRAKNALFRLLPAGEKVLLRPEYDVEHLRWELFERGLGTAPWDRFVSGLPESAEPVGIHPPSRLSEVETEPRWRELTTFGDLDLSAAAAERLALWWKTIIPQAWGAFVGARNELKRRGIRAVVVPLSDDHRDAAVLEAARRERVPVFMYQHGGFAGACDYSLWESVDLRLSDTMFFYGEGSAAHYRERLKRYPDRRAEPVAVGSPRLDLLRTSRPDTWPLRLRLNEGRAPEAPLVLYFPTMHAGYTRYLCCGEYPDVGHWELQRDIARLFKKFPGARLVYRPFEGRFESPMAALLATELPSAVHSREGSLLEAVRAVDAVITDIPSTGMLEALLTDRPILAFADERYVKLKPEAAALLAKRASISTSAPGFLSSIEGFLKRGDFAPLAKPDTAFLDAYGLHSTDGRSAGRAADIIRDRIA